MFVPVGTPPPKKSRPASAVRVSCRTVQGTYSDAWSMAAAIGAIFGWLNATTTFTLRIYVVEATRTVAYEVFERSACPTGSQFGSAPGRC